MSDAYKKIEVVGVSPDSFSKAVDAAIEKAASSVHNLAWFEVAELRGRITDKKISQYQATVKIGFKID